LLQPWQIEHQNLTSLYFKIILIKDSIRLIIIAIDI
jgi:hypothetical protein